jgi:cytochrome b561
MNPGPSSAARYDSRSIALHWLTAALVVVLWSLGQTIDFFPKGSIRIAARSVHISLGATLALVLAYRIWWRLARGTRLPPAGTGWLDLAVALAHRLLYLLLVSTVVLGLANAWVRGDTLFNLVRIPALDPNDRGLRETVEDWHGLSADALVIVAALHAAAGIFHHVVLKDGVLRRMLSGRHR